MLHTSAGGPFPQANPRVGPCKGGLPLLRCAWGLTMAALLLGGCASAVAPPPRSTPTLAGTASLPSGEIEALYSPAKWAHLRDLEYEGYAVMEAEIQADGTVLIGRPIAVYPDAAWLAKAKDYGRRVVLRSTNLGSHLGKRAEITVVFFRPVLEGRLVLVFGQEMEPPRVGMTQPGKYLQTFLQ